MGKRKGQNQEYGMKELWKISYESYILLDMKSVMTSEEKWPRRDNPEKKDMGFRCLF